MMKILLVDDDELLAEALRDALPKAYALESCVSGGEGLRLAAAREYDLIILDLTLPDFGGKHVCKKLRASGIAVPIIILTGTSDTREKVELLNIGADDYLTKPFDVEELEARLRALSRRPRTCLGDELKIHDLVMNIRNRTVSRRGKKIDLRRKEFDILEYLVRASPRVVTKQQIHDYLWNDDREFEVSTIAVHIKFLRDKVDRQFDLPLIQTIHGLGYKIDAPLSNRTGARKEVIYYA